MENKNGRGIFLGVVSVATLVVAIIGATFAFFSASGGSANNAIRATATQLEDLTFTPNGNSKLATNLIPVAAENTNFKNYPSLEANGCIDDRGNEICSLYEFTVSNPADVAQTIYLTLVPASNTFTNLYFAAFKGSVSDITTSSASGADKFAVLSAFEAATSANVYGTPTATTLAANTNLCHAATRLTSASVDLTACSTTLTAADTNSTTDEATYTVLVWLQETGVSQNTTDMTIDDVAATFAAGINVNTGSGTTGVTGVLSAAGPSNG